MGLIKYRNLLLGYEAGTSKEQQELTEAITPYAG